jgi:hypothetical protein
VPTPAPVTSCANDPLNSPEVCCTQKALKGDFSDSSCNPVENKPIDWKFWILVLLAVVILAVIGFFVYKKYFAPQSLMANGGEIVNDFNDEFNGNFDNGDFNNGEFNNEYGNDGIDVEDLEILNMPNSVAPSASPVAPSASPVAPSASPAASFVKSATPSMSPVAK